VSSGKYFLGDAGYSNTSMTLVPYRGIHYHLRETVTSNMRLQTKEELFNLHHASLRNVIKRAFGILKRRWRILQQPPEYAMREQAALVYVTVALHNWIQRNDDSFEWIEAEVDIESGQLEQEEGFDTISELGNGQEEDPDMKRIRDEIVQAMWDDYCRYKAE
jgi:hypothetical protein